MIVDQSRFQSPAWYNAMTLRERIASLRACVDERPRPESDDETARHFIESWRAQSPFQDEMYFHQRLAQDGINEDDFRYLLGEPPETVRARFPEHPPWLSSIVEAFSRPAPTDDWAITLPSSELPEHVRQSLGFLVLIEPLIRRGRERLRAGIEALAHGREDLPFDSETVESLLWANLPWPLVAMLSRTMILELNVARLLGLLAGETPEERFNSFIERLREPDNSLAILEEYPVLARQLVTHINYWTDFSLEFLRHLSADWDELRAMFSPDEAPGLLAGVQGGAGDSHRGGRAVLIAKFSSGFEVVYKPRPLAVDVHFQELLAWLNERGVPSPFRALKVLNRETYGWAEFVAARPCTTLAEVRRFYERQGGYLALLYALEATDFHFENLIATGEHPVLIDLESLFQPRVEGVSVRQPDLLLANSTTMHSILRVGLLPQRMMSKDDYEGIDVSGLGGAAGQLSPDKVVQWERAGTDEMSVVRQRVAMPEGRHRPRLEGAEVNVLDYTDAIAAGFTGMYQLLLERRDELLAETGPLARFAHDEVRAIVRDTRSYGLLLYESFHPDLLRNALDRELFFDRLWVGVEEHAPQARFVASEREDLQEGDIPFFMTRPDSPHLWSSSGRKIADFFDEPGMALARRRLEKLNSSDLKQQLWFLRASLTALSIELDDDKWPTYPLVEPQSVVTSAQLLLAARAVFERLEALALRGEEDVTWLGVAFVTERHCSLMSLSHDLYEGLPGVALFLAYLGAVCEEERATALARLALATTRRQVERSKSAIKRIGAYNGWGGIIYTLAHLGVLWDDAALLAEAEEMVSLLPPLIEEDETFDIINGSAGCIAGLLALYACRPRERTLETAIRCGEHLVNSALVQERGIGWDTKVPAKKPATGFSHGAAGIAWALMELFAATKDERFRAAALAGMEYERALFSPESGNWLDQRDLGSFGRSRKKDKQGMITAWCYGAPGIGLARLHVLRHRMDDATIRAEIETALRTTLADGFGLNHSLCHGDLGNLELIIEAAQVFDDPQLKLQVQRLSSIILESINRHGWLCGIPLGVESPGLLTGLAGIGYGLLRLAEPSRVPSVLILAPPLPCG